MKRRFLSTVLIITLLSVALILAACNGTAPPGPQANSSEPQSSQGQKVPLEKSVKLYFPSADATRLLLETRGVSNQSGELYQLVYKELLAGPRNPGAITMIPKETKLLGAKRNGTSLELNFSRELTQPNVGSFGEILLVDSLVNTFTSLEGVDSVAILIDGKTVQSLAGHVDIAGPLRFNAASTIKLGPVPIPLDAAEIQRSVDNGHQPWRLDPLQVTREEGAKYGFDPKGDTYTLLNKVERGKASGTGEAEVLVEHINGKFVVQLLQPTGPGKDKIWSINSVNLYRGQIPNSTKG